MYCASHHQQICFVFFHIREDASHCVTLPLSGSGEFPASFNRTVIGMLPSFVSFVAPIVSRILDNLCYGFFWHTLQICALELQDEDLGRIPKLDKSQKSLTRGPINATSTHKTLSGILCQTSLSSTILSFHILFQTLQPWLLDLRFYLNSPICSARIKYTISAFVISTSSSDERHDQ